MSVESNNLPVLLFHFSRTSVNGHLPYIFLYISLTVFSGHKNVLYGQFDCIPSVRRVLTNQCKEPSFQPIRSNTEIILSWPAYVFPRVVLITRFPAIVAGGKFSRIGGARVIFSRPRHRFLESNSRSDWELNLNLFSLHFVLVESS